MVKTQNLLLAAAMAVSMAVELQAQEAEDSSADFKASNEALGSALGIRRQIYGDYPRERHDECSDGFGIHENAGGSAEPDGTLSYGHAGNPVGAQAFIDNPSAGNRGALGCQYKIS